MAWDSQIDTPGDQVGYGGNRLQNREFASGTLLQVHRGLGGGLEPPGTTCCIHEGLSEELETGCHCPQSWREQG